MPYLVMLQFFKNSSAHWMFVSAVGFCLPMISGCQPKATTSKANTDLQNAATQSPTKTPTLPVHFAEVAAQAGLNYEWKIKGKRPLNILQTIGNGCAFLDYNRDGNLDVLLVGNQPALFRGDGHGKFVEVSAQSGISKLSAHFLGCAVGDYDNDGWADIYLSGYGTGVLLHNERGQKFANATPSAMKPQPWGTSCAWGDVNGDGKLDLFVSNYVRFGPGKDIPQMCESHGVKVACGPRFYKPIKGVFYQNLGAGRFVRNDAMINMSSTHGRGLAIAFAPLDDSGHPTLAMANDELPGDLLAPEIKKGTAKQGAPNYENIALAAGTAFDRGGNVHGGMGADWGDYDSDGNLDLFITTYEGENKSLYRNEGEQIFTDASYQTGIAASSMPNVAFGCKWIDYDNDGWLDLIFTSGHIQNNVRELYPTASYRQKTLLFHNKGGQRVMFENVSESAGPAFSQSIVGRGLAKGDYDNDGRVDVLIVDSEGKPLLLHNETTNAGNWAGIQLVGIKSPRDGQGALLTATIGAQKRVSHCQTGGSYLSASDVRVHFGLGTADKIDNLTIQWASGQRDVMKNLPANRYLIIEEGGKLLNKK